VRAMRALLLVIAIGCGGSKAPAPSNESKHNPALPKEVASGDCMEGGIAHADGKAEAGCKYFGEVMGTPKPDGTGTVVKCCYGTAALACKNTSGCELADCTFDAKATAPTPITCKDTTHGGVGPTNP
jgi:hypothetical protein